MSYHTPEPYWRYICRMRNDAKREYAKAYLNFLKAGEPEGAEPERGAVSYMAAQGVRIQLRALFNH